MKLPTKAPQKIFSKNIENLVVYPYIAESLLLFFPFSSETYYGSLGNVEYLFIDITPRSTLTGVVVPIRVPSMGQIELFTNG